MTLFWTGVALLVVAAAATGVLLFRPLTRHTEMVLTYAALITGSWAVVVLVAAGFDLFVLS